MMIHKAILATLNDVRAVLAYKLISIALRLHPDVIRELSWFSAVDDDA